MPPPNVEGKPFCQLTGVDPEGGSPLMEDVKFDNWAIAQVKTTACIIHVLLKKYSNKEITSFALVMEFQSHVTRTFVKFSSMEW